MGALDKAKLDGLKKIEDIKEKAAEKQGKASAQEKRMSDSEVKKIRIAEDLKLSDQALAMAKAKEAMAASAGQKALDGVAEKLKAQQVKAEEAQASLAVKEAKEKEVARAKAMEVSEKKVAGLEKQSTVLSEEQASKAKIQSQEAEVHTKKQVAKAENDRVKKADEEKATKKKEKAASAASVEAIRVRDLAANNLKQVEMQAGEEIAATTEKANADEEKKALKAQEKTDSKIEVAKRAEEVKERNF